MKTLYWPFVLFAVLLALAFPVHAQQCEPLPDGSGCTPVTCPIPGQDCLPTCVVVDRDAGDIMVTQCECIDPGTCHVDFSMTRMCVTTNNGTGTADLPPEGCAYHSPDEVWMIIDGLPPGATIEIDGLITNFFLVGRTPGGPLGGEIQNFQATFQMPMEGTGPLAGFSRYILMGVTNQTHSAPRNLGDPVQSFSTEYYRFEGFVVGDPDFDLLHVTAGTDFGLPSPGHTVLTELPSGDFAVDSFFDITYTIEFVGAPGSLLDGLAGTTLGSIRIQSEEMPFCIGDCTQPDRCVHSQIALPDGSVQVWCTCDEDAGNKEYGDAPESALAYPSMGTMGLFPTCKNVGPALYVEHGLCWAHFGPGCDFEIEGNAGACPVFNPNNYDLDECFGPPDAGLIVPDAFTITGNPGAEMVVPCPQTAGLPLGMACQTAVWGTDVDIFVTNGMPVVGYVNVLMDWDQSGFWNGSSPCPGGGAPEHVLVNHPVPIGFGGPLSALGPPPFLIGPNPGYVWTRFSVSESMVALDWDGTGVFEDGETEDYLLEVTPPPPPPCIKWIQWPDCEIGIDVESWLQADNPQGPSPTVADDWLCDGRPVVGLEWWGSYLRWEPGNSETNVAPPGGTARPSGFFVTWYTDIPATEMSFSRPGDILFTNFYPLADFGTPQPPAGVVDEQAYCVSTLDFLEPPEWEHEYHYTLELPEEDIWNEKDGRVYWLSIEAVYQILPPENRWGWKTTSPEWHWNDDAAFAPDPGDWHDMTYPPPGWEWVPQHPYSNLTVDMSFALLTDICPARCKKWIQPPDMLEGEDLPSMELAGAPICADDFISDGRPITDIHWWGSYIGWDTSQLGSETNPIPPPTGDNYPLGFYLSWHETDPTGICQPGPLLTNIFVNITNCNEVFFGSVTQHWYGQDFFEHEYQYYVDLLDPELDFEPWLEATGGHYWLNIAAEFPQNFDPGSQHNGWGWKITPAVTNCPSVFTLDGGGTWTTNTLPSLHPRGDQVTDLAFELTTTDIPDGTNVVAVITFTNAAASGPIGPTLTSTGCYGCGRQVLQTTSNLPPGVWRNVMTNAYPRNVNIWRIGTLSTADFFRIKAVP